MYTYRTTYYPAYASLICISFCGQRCLYIFETVTVSFATLNDKYVHCVSVGWYSDPVPVLQMATVKVARRRMITKRHV